MKSFRDRNPYLVGLVSVLLLTGVTGFAFAVGLLKIFSQDYEVSAVFADASGLRTDDDVKLAGVEVGRVTNIEADRVNGRVRVTFVVNKGVDIGSGAGAEIRLSSLLGAKHIAIVAPTEGDTMMEELPEAARMIDGPCPDNRPAAGCTAVPFDIFDLTRESTNRIEELDTDSLDELLSDLADVTDGKAATIADLIEGINRVGGVVNDRDEQFASLLDEIDRLSGTLADKDDEILLLVDTSSEILDLIIERRNDLAIVLGESADAVQELDRVIDDNYEQLDGILDSLAPTLDVVAAHQDDLDRGLAWLGPALVQQSRGGEQGPFSDIFVASLGPADSSTIGDLLAVLGLAP